MGSFVFPKVTYFNWRNVVIVNIQGNIPAISNPKLKYTPSFVYWAHNLN